VWIFGNAYHRGPSGPDKVAGVSYGYNGFGLGSANSTRWTNYFGLGLVVSPGENLPLVKENQVAVPSDMIAMADSFPQPGFTNIFAFLLSINSTPSPERHNGGANVSFADGHVISVKNEKLVDSSEANRRRWNLDHQPHFEVSY